MRCKVCGRMLNNSTRPNKSGMCYNCSTDYYEKKWKEKEKE